MFLAGLFGIEEAITKFTIWLSAGVYWVASGVFQIFLVLANGELITTDKYKAMITNVYIIVGVILLFIIAMSLLKGMVDPDNQEAGTSAIKKIILNFITSIIILIVLPTIFGLAFDFQTSVIANQNTIGKFFNLGALADSTSDGTVNNTIKIGANRIVNGVWTAFFNVDEEYCKSEINVSNLTNQVDILECQSTIEADTAWYDFWSDSASLADTMVEVEQEGDFFLYGSFAGSVSDDYISYNFLLSLIGGILLLYVGINYCFDMALRLVKLVFYQIIAPLPIMSRIMPDGKMSGMFSQWIKVTLACYLEVFIRIFILYFAVYLCVVIDEGGFFETVTSNNGFWIGLFTKAFVFMGIITFMKQAPKLFSEATGIDTGNIKLGIREKLKDGGFFAAGSAIGGLIAGRGNPLAAFRAGKSGWKNGDFKGIGTEYKRRQEKLEAKANGAGFIRTIDSMRRNLGLPSSAEVHEGKIKSGKMEIENNSSSDITYKDSKGVAHTIASGATYNIDEVTAEDLKAKKTRNIGAMSEMNDRMRDYDSKIKWAGSQKSWKSDMDDEADKKFNDGKFSHDIWYKDSNGEIRSESVNGKRLTELSQQGAEFLEGSGVLSYLDSDGNIHEFAGTRKEIAAFKSANGIKDDMGSQLQIQNTKTISEKDVRDEVRKKFATSELVDAKPNLIKNKTESFLTTLQNEGGQTGFKYQSYVYNEDGTLKRNKDGSPTIQKGRLTASVNDSGKRVITEYKVGEDGNEYSTAYTDIGNGIVEYKEDGETKQKYLYEIAEIFDNTSKSTTGVLEAQKQAVAESEEYMRARDENEAIDAMLKQREEKIAEELQSNTQRAREASKKYTANKNN